MAAGRAADGGTRRVLRVRVRGEPEMWQRADVAVCARAAKCSWCRSLRATPSGPCCAAARARCACSSETRTHTHTQQRARARHRHALLASGVRLSCILRRPPSSSARSRSWALLCAPAQRAEKRLARARVARQRPPRAVAPRSSMLLLAQPQCRAGAPLRPARPPRGRAPLRRAQPRRAAGAGSASASASSANEVEILADRLQLLQRCALALPPARLHLPHGCCGACGRRRVCGAALSALPRRVLFGCVRAGCKLSR
jgi:hypothetical protein